MNNHGKNSKDVVANKKEPDVVAQENNAVDRQRGEEAVKELLEALGYDSASEALKNTPQRVFDSLQELTTARDFQVSLFPNDSSYSEPILIKDIPFVAVCEHHLLPFRGVAHVGYMPGEDLLGLSVLPYIVEKFAHALTLQEPLTNEIADYIADRVAARGVAVMVEANHECMQVRGVRSATAKTVTYAFRGALKNDNIFKSWFFASMAGTRGGEQHLETGDDSE